jgi:hypothetical protein
MLKQLTMRILGAAIVMIALSFAPSVALAHMGHHEHHAAAQLHGSHGEAVSHEAATPATSATLQQARWERIETPTPAGRNCVGACCTFACAACCAAGLPNFVQFVPLPRVATRVALVWSEIWPDREPESLRRPPKSYT